MGLDDKMLASDNLSLSLILSLNNDRLSFAIKCICTVLCKVNIDDNLFMFVIVFLPHTAAPVEGELGL